MCKWKPIKESRSRSCPLLFLIEDDLSQGKTLLLLLLDFDLDYTIRKVQRTNLGLDMDDTHQYGLMRMISS